MNKSFCLVAFVLLSCVLVASEAQKIEKAGGNVSKSDEDPIKKRVKKDVNAMNDALVKDDLEKVIDLTLPKAIELAGGKKAMLSQLKKGMEEMKSKGIAFQSAEAEDPSDPVASGTDLYIVAPHKIVMKVPGGKLHAKGFVVGVSSDKGKSWKYVNGGANPEAVKAVVPDLPSDLKLPERSKPVFEKE